MASNVPTITIDATGITVPESTAVRTGVLADINTAFGGNLDVTTASTPQAYLADNLTENIQTANAAAAYVMGQMDPNSSQGRFQDGIGRIYFMTRKAATSSTVPALCTGSPGLTLAAGTMVAQDTAGYQWSNSDACTFSPSGTATVTFACQTTGPITLAIGGLTTIAQTISGWDAITNTVAASVGTAVESTAAFEERRRESVAVNARGSAPAVRAALRALSGVTDVFAYDNFTNAAITYGATSTTIKPHSLYVAVEGGVDADVAQAIFTKKDGGCDLNGNTSYTLQDTSSGVAYPYPQYVITWERPVGTAAYFAVSLANNASLPSDIVTQVKTAVLAVFNGTADSTTRARIGGTVYASNYYGQIAAIATSVSILSVKVGFTSSPTADSITFGIDQLPTLDASAITVTLV